MRKVLAMFVLSLVVACGEAETVVTADPRLTCLERPFRAALHVDATDPRLVWATNFDTGRDVTVRARPPGRFTIARGSPATLLDSGGNIVSFDGEITRTGCFDAASQVVYIGPQDVPDPNRPPN